MALGKLLNFSVVQVPDRSNERANIYNLKLLGELRKIQEVRTMIRVIITVDNLELMD